MSGTRSAGRAVRLLGSQVAVADLLGVARGTVAAWVDGSEVPGPGHERRLAALVAVLDRVAVAGEPARRWLHRPSAALDGALPLDVALVDGAARVLAAFEDEVGG